VLSSFQCIYRGTGHSHKVVKLSELTRYAFRISACNDAGSGPYSDTVCFTTSKAPPATVKGLLLLLPVFPTSACANRSSIHRQTSGCRLTEAQQMSVFKCNSLSVNCWCSKFNAHLRPAQPPLLLWDSGTLKHSGTPWTTIHAGESRSVG